MAGLAQAGGLFANPLGLLGLGALAVLIVLYLVRPDPEEYAIPTVEFLSEGRGDSQQQRIRDRFRISGIFLLQALVLLAIPLALAGPQVPLPGSAAGDTVVVVDTSASMAATGEESTRFKRARETARSVTGDQATVVTSAPDATVKIADGSTDATAAALSGLSVSETDGDLRRAIRVAADIHDDNRRIVVISDFVDATDWRAATESARAAGNEVVVERVGGGGQDNVGIVGLSVTSTEATVTVTNGGETQQTRDVSLGGSSKTVQLTPGDVTKLTLPIPSDGGEVRLSPGDSFRLDDTAYVATPSNKEIDTLVVTNDENTFLTAALRVIDDITVEIAAPPVSDPSGYDVVVFSNVDPDRVLSGTLTDVEADVENGAGVVIQGQADLGAVGYGRLALIEPGRLGPETGVRAVASHPVIDGIGVVPASAYLTGEIQRGQALAVADDGSPMIAVGEIGAGRAVYYGYIEDQSPFKFNYLYPVFWRQSMNYAAGRTPIEKLNRASGETIAFESATSVETPSGSVETTRLTPTETGFYGTQTARYGVSLQSPSESTVVSEPIDIGNGVAETGSTPQSLMPWLALFALLAGVTELGYLKYRGEL